MIGSRLEGEPFEVTKDPQQDQQYSQVDFEEGKRTKGPLLPMNYYHLHSCMCLIWIAFKDFT